MAGVVEVVVVRTMAQANINHMIANKAEDNNLGIIKAFALALNRSREKCQAELLIALFMHIFSARRIDI